MLIFQLTGNFLDSGGGGADFLEGGGGGANSIEDTDFIDDPIHATRALLLPRAASFSRMAPELNGGGADLIDKEALLV